jgi:general secretion pathway protein M
MEKLQQIKQWFFALPVKEQQLLSGATALIIVTLFYLMVWEPVHLELKSQQQTKQSQTKILQWMQEASAEVKALRVSGSSGKIRDKNKPTTLVIERSINNAGLKTSVNKIESAGKNGARVTLKNAPFNQVLTWLNTLSRHNGILVVSANIERTSNKGKADVRLTFERP